LARPDAAQPASSHAPSPHLATESAVPSGEAPEGMIRRILASSRFFIAIAVLGLFLAAVALLVTATVGVVEITWDAVVHGDVGFAGAKHLSVQFIELTDAFLLATVLYIVALGLYQLFLDAELPVSGWLKITDLDELKEKLLGVIIVLLGVSFLDNAVEWEPGTSILPFGAAIALVSLALSVLLFVAHWHRRGH
jgi:uncharacterized membrane protein YqhA